jgi:hypothetical protein
VSVTLTREGCGLTETPFKPADLYPQVFLWRRSIKVGGSQERGDMFERFTDHARRVVVLAQEEARRLNHNYIGTEHLLLGLLHEGGGVAAKALESLGISLDGVREQVQEIIGQGQQAPLRPHPLHPACKEGAGARTP